MAVFSGFAEGKKVTVTKKGDSHLFPIQLGYRMPAEWELHEATWLTWPHNPETWSDLPTIESIYLDLIEVIVHDEWVHLLVQNKKEREVVSRKLAKRKVRLSQIHFHEIPTCDSWIRDYGPNFIVKTTLKERKAAVNRWIFNAWGSKYEEHLLDNDALQKIIAGFKVPVFETNFVLEGGSIDTNGNGIVLTTEQCLLHTNRNAHLSKDKIELHLKNYLGADKIVWLAGGIEGDDTDGHVDDLARFVNETTILVAVEPRRKDKNYAALRENFRRLKKAKNQNRNPFDLVELPMPQSVVAGGSRLPASYANFYITNAAVLVPIFDDPNDQEALRIIGSFFDDRTVIGIRSEKLLEGLGGIHCITHEQPAL